MEKIRPTPNIYIKWITAGVLYRKKAYRVNSIIPRDNKQKHETYSKHLNSNRIHVSLINIWLGTSINWQSTQISASSLFPTLSTHLFNHSTDNRNWLFLLTMSFSTRSSKYMYAIGSVCRCFSMTCRVPPADHHQRTLLLLLFVSIIIIINNTINALLFRWFKHMTPNVRQLSETFSVGSSPAAEHEYVVSVTQGRGRWWWIGYSADIMMMWWRIQVGLCSCWR